MSTDRIERQVVVKAPRARVWRAICDSKEFGDWFRASISGAFSPGAHLKAKVLYPGYEHITFDMWIEKMEPERLFSYRWHPHCIDTKMDYSKEPTTLVEFRLEDVKGGTKLTVIESGFDGIPVTRRAEAYRGNEGGWEAQVKAVAAWVEGREGEGH